MPDEQDFLAGVDIEHRGDQRVRQPVFGLYGSSAEEFGVIIDTHGFAVNSNFRTHMDWITLHDQEDWRTTEQTDNSLVFEHEEGAIVQAEAAEPGRWSEFPRNVRVSTRQTNGEWMRSTEMVFETREDLARVIQTQSESALQPLHDLE